MTIGGWVFMLLSVVFVWGLTLWCYRHVMANHGKAEDEP